MKIQLIKSTFHDEYRTKQDLCDFIMSSNKLSMGEQCIDFEKRFAKFQERKHAVMFNSGSSANLAILQSLMNLGRIQKGDNCFFSSVTWSTNVMPIIQLGLNPIPVDINLSNLNVGSSELLRALDDNKNIKIFFISNILGFCSDIDEVKKICEERNIILIEDNCESLGTEYKDIKLGNFGIASSCSTYVGHHMSTIEGGVVFVDDNDLYNMLKMVRAHGWNRNLNEEIKTNLRNNHLVDEFYDMYTFYDLAYNIRPNEITAFIGNKQLNYLVSNIDRRENNFLKLNEVANKNNRIIPINNKKITKISNFAFPIVLKDHIKIKNVIEKYINAGVEIRPMVAGNIVNQPFYSKYVNSDTKSLTNAEYIHNHSFYFPNHPELSDDEIQYLQNLITDI